MSEEPVKRPAEPLASEDLEEPPPLLGSWRRIYGLLLFELALTVLALYALASWAA